MKKVQLRNVSHEEMEAKKIVLETGKIFPTKFLQILNKGGMSGLEIELSDEQCQVLKALNLVEKEEKIEEPKKKESLREPITNYNQSVKEEEAKSEQTTLEKIEMSSEGEIEEKMEEPRAKEEEPQKEEPQKEDQAPRKINQKEKEKEGKMYYLTPERMIESIKMVNRGKIWEHLAYTAQDRLTLQMAIERAYRSCVYPSDLTNPNFLDERVGAFLPENNQAVQLKEIHMATLMNTYVGYHIEQNAVEVENLNAAGNERANVGIAKFPTLVSDMPEELKAETREELTKSIGRRIEDIMYSNHSYRALAIMIPIERTIDEAIEEHSKSLNGREEKEAMQAYIKAIRKDLKNEMKPDFNEFNVEMRLHDVDWSNPSERKAMIDLIKELQSEGHDTDISKLIEKVEVPYTIDSPEDLKELKEACEDLGELKDAGIDVSIAFDISPEQLENPRLHEELNEIVDEYDNIERDYGAEVVENGVDLMIAKGVAYSLRNEMELPKEPSVDQGEEKGKQAKLNEIAMLADSIEPYDLEREDMEEERRRQDETWN